VAAFGTAEDLASFLQVPTVDRYTAELLLDLASDAVRGETGLDIDVATTTEAYDGLDASNLYAGTVFLRQRPVTAVSGVSDAGVLLVPVTQYEWSAGGVISRVDGLPFTDLAGGILVTYTHGWATNTREWRLARMVTLQVAARAYVNPLQVDSVTVGGITRTYPRSEPRTGRLELTEFEKRRLDPLRR